MDLPERLRLGRAIPEPVALVVAHPDDEMVGLGSRLCRFDDLTLIHLTDGAPRDLRDAHRAGFSQAETYAAAREAELQASLLRLGARPKRIRYNLPDKETGAHLPGIVVRLRSDLAGMAAVITQPYEHGHPDHDSAALAVALAAPRLPRFECAYYHLAPPGPRFGVFWADPACPETVLTLTAGERTAKAEAIACFATQQVTLAQFELSTERLRPAPAYDFARPAPPGAALYEHWDFPENAADWRARAALLLEPACAA